MALLAGLSSSNNPQKGTLAVQILLQTSPFLRFLNQTSGFELAPTDFNFRPVTATSTAPARAEGASYTPTDTVPLALTSASLKMHGDGVDIDVTRKADAAAGLISMDTWYLNAVKAKLLEFAKAYEGLLFNGSGTSNNIEGLKTILDGTDLPGYTGVTRVINAADYSVDSTPKSLDITVSATNYEKNIKRCIELLNYAMGQVNNPAGIVVSRATHSRVTTIAGDRAYAGNVSLSTDSFGRQVTNFNGVPLIPVLPNTILANEPDDTTGTPKTETTSIYILSPAEMQFSLVTNSGLQYWAYDAQENKESAREKWEIRAAWKIQDPLNVMRIRNIKI